MPPCAVIQNNGNPCTKDILPEEVCCKVHKRVLNRMGKIPFEVKQLKDFHKREYNVIMIEVIKRIERNYNIDWYGTNNIEATRIYYRCRNWLNRTHHEDKNVFLNAQVNEGQHRKIDTTIRDIPWNTFFPVVRNNDLQLIAVDNQNVHRTAVVDEVKKTIQTLLDNIHVPPEYETRTQKVIGEIILECKLSPFGTWQMVSKYCSNEDIYEYPKGIYAEILNRVWVFIKDSEHKEDLKKILKSEMEDNIGMCAQGNLSRLCNILSGYMEGIDLQTQGDKLQNLMAELYSKTMNIDEKISEAKKILKELDIESSQWAGWIDAMAN